MYHNYKSVERVKPGGLELKDSLVGVQRVTKVTKGGRTFGFSAIVVVGDENGVVGHGLGRNLHEKPEVPNFGKRGSGKKLLDGMVLAIEPMINMGTDEVVHSTDGWTVSTKDGMPSAHYEHNVALIDGKPKLLSTFDFIYDALGIKSSEENEFKWNEISN